MPKTTRQLAIADHLWDVYARMAAEMGSDRDALVNEAMHLYARLHGFVVPGSFPVDMPEHTPVAPDRRAVAERVLETAERLERDIARPPPVPAPGAGADVAARPPPVPIPGGGPGVLRLQREDGAVLELAQERYVIGRGGHCDLVIDSAKISREHAAFVRSSDGWWIEDLGSSNGTWFKGERISRRRVEHGDEYFLCAERFRCALR